MPQPPSTVRLVYFKEAEDEFARSDLMRDFMQRVGDEIARDAERHAPVRHPVSHGGARSIHAETNLTPKGWRAKISWDKTHYYLRFTETGTKYMPARPFLRPALERARI